MHCSSCGGPLARPTAPCPFCHSRPEVDLRHVNHRDLGPAPGMACPRCERPLEIRRLQPAPDAPPINIERCLGCHGLFFNPGELESLLHLQVAETVWLDLARMQDLEDDASADPSPDAGAAKQRHYLPCPSCHSLMTPLNYGSRSGVLIDRCPQHGVWLDGGELRTIAEWWHAGGKHVHQAIEVEKARELRAGIGKRVEMPPPTLDRTPFPDPSPSWEIASVFDLLGGLASAFVD